MKMNQSKTIIKCMLTKRFETNIKLVNFLQTSDQQLAHKVKRLFEGLKSYQERLWSRNGQGIFHNSAINRERWSRRSDCATLGSCKMTCYHVSDENKQYKFSVFISYPVCSLHFFTRFAVCILYWPDWYCCFCSSEPQVRTEMVELEKNLLVRLFDRYDWRVDWRVTCETTSVLQCNFRPRNPTSVHGRQLPSTSASPQYLIYCFQHEWA